MRALETYEYPDLADLLHRRFEDAIREAAVLMRDELHKGERQIDDVLYNMTQAAQEFTDAGLIWTLVVSEVFQEDEDGD